MRIAASEMILREDGSIYHLKLKAGQISDTIITVGDPDRVDQVTQHFEKIESTIQAREFKTTTGYYQGKRLSVISTGIGTDNIDIVFNELDALVNVDFEERTINEQLKRLKLIRIGTSGTMQADIPVDSFLISVAAIGMDGLMEYYQHETNPQLAELKAQISNPNHYVSPVDQELLEHFQSDDYLKGITITAKGFYAPQNRSIRLQPNKKNFFEALETIQWNGYRVTNLEMETAGIYSMATLLGHQAISFNAILANRRTGEFSAQANKTVETLIKKVLDAVVQLD